VTLKTYAIIGGALLASGALGFWAGSRYVQNKAEEKLAWVLLQNEGLQKVVNDGKEEAARFRQDAIDLDARGVDKDKRISELKTKLAKFTGKPLDPLPGLPGVDVSGPAGDPEVVVLRELVSAQDDRHLNDEARIKARDGQIAGCSKALAASERQVENFKRAITPNYKRSVIGLVGYDLRQHMKVYGSMVNYNSGAVTVNTGFIGQTVFVGAGVRF